MPDYSYELGTTVGNRVNVETLFGTPPKGWQFNQNSIVRKVGDGTLFGDGYPTLSGTLTLYVGLT